MRKVDQANSKKRAGLRKVTKRYALRQQPSRGARRNEGYARGHA